MPETCKRMINIYKTRNTNTSNYIGILTAVKNAVDNVVGKDTKILRRQFATFYKVKVRNKMKLCTPLTLY